MVARFLRGREKKNLRRAEALRVMTIHLRESFTQ